LSFLQVDKKERMIFNPLKLCSTAFLAAYSHLLWFFVNIPTTFKMDITFYRLNLIDLNKLISESYHQQYIVDLRSQVIDYPLMATTL
jgi:hypothetical protein